MPREKLYKLRTPVPYKVHKYTKILFYNYCYICSSIKCNFSVSLAPIHFAVFSFVLKEIINITLSTASNYLRLPLPDSISLSDSDRGLRTKLRPVHSLVLQLHTSYYKNQADFCELLTELASQGYPWHMHIHTDRHTHMQAQTTSQFSFSHPKKTNKHRNTVTYISFILFVSITHISWWLWVDNKWLLKGGVCC